MNGYRVTSKYGYRKDPITGKNRVFHAGIDLVKEHKAPIYAFVSGLVKFAGLGKPGTGLGGYGNVVLIEDRAGRGHLYAHLNSVTVKAGQRVVEGTRIGYQGATGQATGSHLHYEVRKKTSPSYGWTSNKAQSTIDPTPFITGKQTGSNVGKTLYLDSSNKTWNIYKKNVTPISKNANSIPLRPAKFGGLSYKILANPAPHVYTIKTSQFGEMNIVVKPEYTGYTIK